MQVLAHPDPVVLEEELLRRVAEAQAADPMAPVLVVVPTARLGRHVSRRLALRDGARLAVDVLHHRGVTLRILEECHPGRHSLASWLLLEAVLDRVLDGLRDNPWCSFLAERPGARRGLMGALTDLREAGISAGEARKHLRADASERALAEIYAAYAGALERAAGGGLLDETGIVRAALSLAPIHAARYRAILHHGAYDLIGIHLDLIRALDRGRELTFLLPAEPGAPAYEFALTFAERHLLAPGQRLKRLEHATGGLLGDRLAALYDESRVPEPLEPGSVRLWNTQGALAEVTLAARHALRSAGAGLPPAEIAIVARGLSPYSGALEQVLEEQALPWSGSFLAPLRRDPVVHDLLVLLQVVARDFPRAPTAELLRSPRLRWKALLPDEAAPRGDLAEAWSRRAGVLRGLEEWAEQLPAWAETAGEAEDVSEEERCGRARHGEWRASEARKLARALVVLERRVDPRAPRRWTEHADVIEALARDVLQGAGDERPDPARTALLGLIEEMRRLATRVGDDREVPFARMLEWLERAVDGTEIPVAPDGGGGIQVLDAMQARGLTFGCVHLLGFHGGLFPRAVQPDPFLPDTARSRLGQVTRRPVPVKSDGGNEERLLLALLLGSARGQLVISWQRADEAGRSKAPSLALREVARVIFGKADLEIAVRSASAFPAHPAQALEKLMETGLLAPPEGTLLLAFRARSPEQAESVLGDRSPHLLPGLRMLRATESFASGEASYDGEAGPQARLAQTYSVTALESLGRCPLQYFFRHVLAARELEEEASPFEVAPREVGDRVHRVLESLYRQLDEEKLFEEGRDPLLQARARELLPQAWTAVMGDLVARLGRRAPVLSRRLQERWLESLAAFVGEDFAQLGADGLRPVGLEDVRETRVPLGGGVELRVKGRIDRALAGLGDRIVVSDYKTAGKISRFADVGEMLRGRGLQAPLYGMLRGEASRVEFLGVGPNYHDPDEERPQGERRSRFEGFQSPEQGEGFLETMRVLMRLADSGRFPLNPDWHCAWCAYRRACRHGHPPTLHRRDHATDLEDFRDVQQKTSHKKPTLDLVRRGGKRRERVR